MDITWAVKLSLYGLSRENKSWLMVARVGREASH